MHPVHFAPGAAGLVHPLCGDWGAMDSDWTGDPGGVTCPACLRALRAGGRLAGAPAPERLP